MKLGVAGLLRDGSPEAARRIRELGFCAASWHLPDPGVAEDSARLHAVRETLEAEELELCQLLPPVYPSLVHPDAAARKAGLELLRATLRAARVLNAGNVYVRPGSLNPAGAWSPHPQNRSTEVRDRLIDSLRRLVPAAGNCGVPLALEGHVLSPLYSPGVMRQVLQAVGSPWLKINADPVNLLGTLDLAYHPTSLVHELFDLLGEAVVTGHVKDVAVRDGFVLHIDECVPGQGHMDHETFLRRFEECCPRGAILIEHLPVERVPEARRAMLDFAARAGLEFEKA